MCSTWSTIPSPQFKRHSISMSGPQCCAWLGWDVAHAGSPRKSTSCSCLCSRQDRSYYRYLRFCPCSVEHKNPCSVGCRTAQDIGSTWEPVQPRRVWFEKVLPGNHCSSVGRCGSKEMSELGCGFSFRQGPWDSVGVDFVRLEDSSVVERSRVL